MPACRPNLLSFILEQSSFELAKGSGLKTDGTNRFSFCGWKIFPLVSNRLCLFCESWSRLYTWIFTVLIPVCLNRWNKPISSFVSVFWRKLISISSMVKILNLRVGYFQGFHEDLESKRTAVNDTIDKCNKMLRETTSEDADDIKNKLNTIRTQADLVCKLSSERLALLEEALPLASHFRWVARKLLFGKEQEARLMWSRIKRGEPTAVYRFCEAIVEASGS